jgi:hypothetical protein
MMSMRNCLKVLLTTGAILGVGLGIGRLRYGSFWNTIAAVRGQSVAVEPRQFSAGEVQPGESVVVSVRLRNLTTEPVRVIGSHANCGCTVTDRWPLELQPGEAVEVQLSLKVPLAPTERFELPVVFYLLPRALEPEFVLTGRVRPVTPDATQVPR